MHSSIIIQLFTISTTTCFFLFLSHFHHFAVGQGLGVTLARNMEKPPPAAQIVHFCLDKGIKKMRVYDGSKDRDLLKAISDSQRGIEVMVGVGKEDVYRIASDLNSVEAEKWLKENIIPHSSDLVYYRCILVGNEPMVLQGNRDIWAAYLALAHLKTAMNKLGLDIALGIYMDVRILTESFPPSAAEFGSGLLPVLRPLLTYMSRHMGCIVIPMYPTLRYQTDIYYEYKGVPLGYALLNSDQTVVTDKGLAYTNMMDGILDAFHTALAKMGFPYMRVLVGETGWPSQGLDKLANPKYAGEYLYNLAERLKNNQGTPMKPNWKIETFIHTLYVQDGTYMAQDEWYGMFNSADNSTANSFLLLPTA